MPIYSTAKPKRFIEFYQQYKTGEYAPCIGVNSVINVDNRWNNSSIEDYARRFPYKPETAVAFKICSGTRILDCKPITELIYLNYKK